MVLHGPHSSREIPAWVRQHIVLDGHNLDAELDRMTDSGTSEAAETAQRAPWLFVNRRSRLQAVE